MKIVKYAFILPHRKPNYVGYIDLTEIKTCYMPNFYPDIYEYLETVHNQKSVSAKDLDEMVLKIRAQTGLSRDICSEIVKYFFQEMRNTMLRGDQVVLRGLGKLYIASPRAGSRRKIFTKFEPYNKLLRKVDGT